MPQVRAAPGSLQPTRPGGARGKAKSKAPCEPNIETGESAGALPQVASTSTVLAPIGAKTNYIGPALLRSRKMGLKRSGSSSENARDDCENLKKPRSENSAPSGPSQCLFSFRALSSRGMDSLEVFTARRIAQFRVPFKVPFNTVPVNPQATSKSGGPTKAKPSRDSNNALEDIHIDLVGENESDEEDLPCGSESGLKCGPLAQFLSLSSLASPLSLTDHEVDLDVSFSQKIPASFLPYETTLDDLTVLSHRKRTGTPHTENFDERCARFSCTTLGVMKYGTNSSRCHQMRRQGM